MKPGFSLTSVQQSYLLAVLTVLFWSTVATAFKLSLESIDIYQMLFISCLTSTLVLLALSLLRLLVQGNAMHPSMSLRALFGPSLVRGLLNPLAYYLVLFAAYDRLPAQVVQPINYSWVIVLTFMSIVFLKQRISRQDVLAGLICYAGVVTIASQGSLDISSSLLNKGVILAILSTLIWASYWILNIRDQREPLLAMFANFALALPLVGLACYLFSDFNFLHKGGLYFAVYIGVFEMSVAFLCWSLALKKAENSARVGNLIFVTPFLSLMLIHHILGEQIYVTTWVGLLLIVGGLLMQKFGGRRSRR